MSMQNQTKVSQWGNSLAIRIPKGLAAELAIERGINVELQVENDGFRVRIPRVLTNLYIHDNFQYGIQRRLSCRCAKSVVQGE